MKNIKIFRILVITLLTIQLSFVFVYFCISGNGLLNAFPSVLLAFILMAFFKKSKHAKIVLTILYTLLSLFLILIYLLQSDSSLSIFSMPLIETFATRLSLFRGKFLFYLFIVVTLLVNITLPFFKPNAYKPIAPRYIILFGKASLYCIVLFLITSSFNLITTFFNNEPGDYLFSLKQVNYYVINFTSTLFNILFMIWLGSEISLLSNKSTLFKGREKNYAQIINTSFYVFLLIILLSFYLPKEFQIFFEISIYFVYYLILNALFKKTDLLLIDKIPNYQDYTDRKFLKKWLIAFVLTLLTNFVIYSFYINIILSSILLITSIMSMSYFVYQTRNTVVQFNEKVYKLLVYKNIKEYNSRTRY